MIAIKRSNLKSLAHSHYNKIMVRKNGSKIKMVVDYLDALKASFPDDDYRIELIEVLEMDLEMVEDDLESSILCCSPETLNNKFLDYNDRFTLLSDDEDFLKALQGCFYYSNYDKWNAYGLAESLSVNVCPYCNRSYTFTIGTDLAKGTRPQFDHYIPKSLAPYFSLSFFNLIPSCSVCNSGFKKTRFLDLKEFIHPYHDDLAEEFVFSIGAKEIAFIDGKAEAYDVTFVKKSGCKLTDIELNRISETYDLFRLKELYQKHKDYVDEIIQSERVFTENRIAGVFKAFEGTLFKSPADVLRMALTNYTAYEDLEKRPLAKLTRDVYQELRSLREGGRAFII